MQSNRESARRSRMKKQKHLDDLTAQISDLTRRNERILGDLGLTTQRYLNVEAENSVLRAQVTELTHRLDSLNEIISYVNCYSGSGVAPPAIVGVEMLGGLLDVGLGNCWNLGFVNLPIAASASVDYSGFWY